MFFDKKNVEKIQTKAPPSLAEDLSAQGISFRYDPDEQCYVYIDMNANEGISVYKSGEQYTYNGTTISREDALRLFVDAYRSELDFTLLEDNPAYESIFKCHQMLSELSNLIKLGHYEILQSDGGVTLYEDDVPLITQRGKSYVFTKDGKSKNFERMPEKLVDYLCARHKDAMKQLSSNSNVSRIPYGGIVTQRLFMNFIPDVLGIMPFVQVFIIDPYSFFICFKNGSGSLCTIAGDQIKETPYNLSERASVDTDSFYPSFRKRIHVVERMHKKNG